MRTITRWTMAGALALAGVGVMGGFAPGAATAEAAPRSVSPFAGSYIGEVPAFGGYWPIKVSSRGAVSGSLSERRIDAIGRGYWIRGDLSGTISDTGVLSATASLTVDAHWEDGGYAGPGLVPKTTQSVRLDATGSFETSGDVLFVVGGGYFHWFAQ